MTAEWLTAIGTIGTFVVIAASATAALVQIRHMRGSNQIVALTECRETLESPEFRKAQRFVMVELPKRLQDPQEVIRLTREAMQFEGDYGALRTVANFFENMGIFVKNRIIDRHLACDMWSFVVLRSWNSMAPWITYIREELQTPALWENFEFLAVLSQEYVRANPQGGYPAGTPRMPEDRSLVDALASARSEAKTAV